MLFNQIGASNMILGISGGPIIVDPLIVVGLLYFLLEPKLFKAVDGN